MLKFDSDTNNRIQIIGKIKTELRHDHNIIGAKIYTCIVEVKRNSGIIDLLPVHISEHQLVKQKLTVDQYVCIKGELHSYNKKDAYKNKMELFIFAKEICVRSFASFENQILLNGFVCKPPTYRKTPLGLQIMDIILAVNRKYDRADYIPCIFWESNAILARQWEIGTNIILSGRMQSRIYDKMIGEVKEIRRAYEVSVSLCQSCKSRILRRG